LSSRNNYTPQELKEQKIVTRFTLIVCLFSIAVYLFYVIYSLIVSKLAVTLVCSAYIVGSLVALILIKTGRSYAAKVFIMVNAAMSVAFSYHSFNISHSVLNIFFPLFLGHLYFFDFEREKKSLALSLGLTGILLTLSLAIPRFYLMKVILPGEIAAQINNVHVVVSMIITSFVLIIIAQNKTRTNRALRKKTRVLEKTLHELRETQEQLIQKEKMATLGMLSAGINHEINNPLNFVVGGIENLKHLNKKLKNEEIKPFIAVLEEGVDRIKSIVVSLNHFSHKAGEHDVLCDLNEILDNC